ncbi:MULTISPECIES: tRNA-modifying protein YgfZ [Vibrio]|uniref:tRNA-modifying protein YgfZ n=1 Tax=Vibrio TaxID=662 RepID=UPI002075451E|nr:MULTISPECIES: tRNA-modifying protein YgfZ [Vibrio]USD32947.1 tRNA-modifying protein YgfZ [Vibrio sp. SCSIO 43186]USD46015.1 tRNA-modifying protein YgfZ [Vibrio sp. SCSIO 43145]USD70071.1 tRNA-modifying protein YgfZ [Vibrio sp. SCSIO 43139]USD94984.1 tRNA-modifying protein YgfZ [Vibrio coralliilyticus]
MEWQQDFAPLSLSSSDSLPELVLTHLTSWGMITAQGDDKKSYLQGQVTCDVVQLAEDETTFGAHCDAKGKVWSVFRLFHHQGGYAMLQPKSAIETELAELKKYAIFSNVEFAESHDVLLGLIGTNANQVIEELSQQSGDVRAIEGGTALKIDEQRWLLAVDSATAAQLCQSINATKACEDIWTCLDINAAIPAVSKEHQGEHIPQALNVQALGGISFSKGCYTGQETVARAKYRGMNKRALQILRGHCESELKAGAEIERSVGDNWRSAGQLMSHYHFNDGIAIGLAVLPNNLDADTQFRLKDEPNTIWTMQSLPYSLEDDE